MMKKIVVVGMIVCIFLVASMCNVSAADVSLTVDDDEDDILDISFNYVSRPNIDIKEVSCAQDGNEVVLKLKLVEGGIIKDSDDIVYSFLLTTTDDLYSIGYVNTECLATDGNENEIDVEDCSGAGGNELQIIFILPGDNEECTEVTGATLEINLATEDYFMDSAPDEDLDFLEVDISGPTTGKTGNALQFSGSASEGTPPYTYTWDFGDGGTSDSQNPTHTYDTAGTYEVYLLVLDSEEKEGVALSTVTITGTEITSNSNNDNSDSGSGLTIFIVLIMVIVIVGVLILIFVIRR
jgi:hypothetical protein